MMTARSGLGFMRHITRAAAGGLSRARGVPSSQTLDLWQRPTHAAMRAGPGAFSQSRDMSSATMDAVGGFSYPGPRKLDEVVKVALLSKHGAPRVAEIWKEYHSDISKRAVGDVLSADEYGLLRQRTQRYSHFVLPVPREGGFFTLYVQFQERQCFMTYLEDYKKNVAQAQPYLTITFFEDLLETKRLALVRAEVTNNLTQPEAKVLLELVKQFYIGPRKYLDVVAAFNEKSEDFDFKTVLRAAGMA